MAYMRGSYYIYRGSKLYINTPEGDMAGLPMPLFDELVAMRWAQLTPAQRKTVQKRAVKKWSGNFGCDELAREMGGLTTMEQAILHSGDEEGTVEA